MKLHIYTGLFFLITILQPFKASSQSVTVSLRADYSHEVTIYHDEPLLLTVTLTNQEAQESSRWNSAADRRLNELEELLKAGKIKQEDYNREKTKLEDGKRQLSSVTIGAAGRPWSSMLKWKLVNSSSGAEVPLIVRAMVNPLSEEIAVLNEKGYYAAYFGIDAEEMKKIVAGSYKIIGSIENEKSEPVMVTVKKESMPATIAGSEETLLKNGQYYWHAGDATQGMLFADKLLQKKPTSVDGLSLKGDLLVLGNSFLPALESYNKALKEFNKQNPGISEPPEYLLETIAWVKKQLGQ